MPGHQSDPIIVGWVQITEPMMRHCNLPYSVGLLQAYIQAHASNPQQYLFLLPVFLREDLREAAQKLALAHVVGFSAYVWNIEYSLALAKALKQLNPKVLIVFGGPQVPDHPEQFLRQHPFIDLCAHGEGEKIMLNILEAYPTRQWQGIAGLSYRVPGGCVTTPKGPRIKDMESIPSPYLSGFFDPLLPLYPKLMWTSPWETNRGCPFSCTFCDWGSATQSKLHRFERERLTAEMEWFAKNKIEIIYCCDSNFGILPRDLEITREIIGYKQKFGYPKVLFTQMTKNKQERAFEGQKLLFEAGMHTSATLSLQSVAPNVLSAIKRDNISTETYHELLVRFVEAGVPSYTDLLVGLPEETFESFVEGVETVLNQGQHQELRFWNVYILPNAELADPAYRQKYGIESVRMPYIPPFVTVAETEGGIQEYQEMLVATQCMSRADWLKMRTFSWMVQSLYFSKLLQFPLLLLRRWLGVPHHAMVRAFLWDPLPGPCPVWEQIRRFFHSKGQEMLQGQPEYVAAVDPESHIPIWYPAQSFVLTHLLYSDKLDALYAESQAILHHLLQRRGQPADQSLPPRLLEEAVLLSKSLFRANQLHNRKFQLTLSYNLWPAYQQLLKSQPMELEKGLWQVYGYMDNKALPRVEFIPLQKAEPLVVPPADAALSVQPLAPH